jgi:hypothetical protein
MGFTTMVARKGTHHNESFVANVCDDERGQSLLEFLLMLPLLLGLIVLMTRVNTAIQASIVDQQYARMQTLWLTFNSPIYPRIALRQSSLIPKNYNQMMIGVAQNEIVGTGQPIASTTMIARTPALAAQGSSAVQVDGPPLRALVRIRNTVSLCTQSNFSGGNPILVLNSSNSGTTGAATPVGVYNLTENAQQFGDYCKGLTTE